MLCDGNFFATASNSAKTGARKPQFPLQEWSYSDTSRSPHLEASPTLLKPVISSAIDVDYQNLLGRSSTGGVVLGSVKGTSAAIKLVDLDKLQSDTIAQLLDGGLIEGYGMVATAPILPGLVLNGRLFKDLTWDDLALAKRSLGRMHAMGWIHGDLQVSNVLFSGDGEGRRALWIDLEDARVGTEEERDDEMRYMELR
ncbi:hypothetical protein BDK51DRAFT_31673 [Blyttiomyces helicus]|uniref:Protein kinase domain-containing protein n=1 Tax=Blyttiomyces helicus TaxID=388810 RepID=A0A4P9VZK1_9FUNG|nr:hypothetical protein BDK51DRAFT_31673 [Blyttiomyces helicus]|eukprot:RKO84435.1 hypothetical protein BDK51DRAFT_31673 [Blyttiomyces helicus]